MGSKGGRAREDAIVSDVESSRYKSVIQYMAADTTVEMTVDTETVLGVSEEVG